MCPSSDSLAALTDADLVLRLCHPHDGTAAGAFAEVYDRYYLPVVRFAGRFALVSDTADDIAQMVFFSVWERRHHLVIRDKLLTYLLGAVRLRALDLLRRERVADRVKSAEPPDSSPAMGATLASPEDVTDGQLLARRIRDALTTLPERQRSALVLRWEQGLSDIEIASVLGIQKAAVYRLLARAVEGLRRAM